MRNGSEDFERLLGRLADAWAARDAVAAAGCFTDDAVYMQPPDEQYYAGREQLIAYFGPLEPGTYLTFRHISFDEATGVGAAEFAFGVAGREVADHGVAIVETRDGLISFWREYVTKGPADPAGFLATDGKDWTCISATTPEGRGRGTPGEWRVDVRPGCRTNPGGVTFSR